MEIIIKNYEFEKFSFVIYLKKMLNAFIMGRALQMNLKITKTNIQLAH